MKIKTILVFAVCLFAIASCKKEESVPQPESQKSFAYLKVGHQWIYDFRYNGGIYDSLTISTVAENKDIYEMFMQDAVTKATSYQYVEGEYLRSYDFGRDKSNAVRIASQNSKQGDTWADFNGQDSLFSTVKQIELSITVPLGTYSCTEIETTYKKSGAKQTYYVNKTNGLIKMVFTSSGSTASYELRKKNF